MSEVTPSGGADQKQIARVLSDLQSSRREWPSPPELATYHGWLLQRLGTVTRLSRDRRASRLELSKIYTPIATEWSVSVTVEDGDVRKAWRSAARDPAQLPNQIAQPADDLAEFGDAAEADIRRLVDVIRDAIARDVDSTYSSPDERPLVLAPPWYSGVKEGFWPIGASDAAALHTRLAVLGPPGSGKTSFVRHLVLQLSSARLTKTSAADLGSWAHGALVPIHVELRRLFASDGSDVGHEVGPEALWAHIGEGLKSAGIEGLLTFLKDELVLGRAILVLDGLDEIHVPQISEESDKRRDQVAKLLGDLDKLYPKSRIILTSRDRAYPSWNVEGFEKVLLAPLSSTDARRLIGRLMSQDGSTARETATATNELMEALAAVPAALKDYPLFLTMMVALHKASGEGLPTRRSSLYRESVLLLLDRWSNDGPNEPSLLTRLQCTAELLHERLQRIAFDVHSGTHGSESPDIDSGTLVAELFKVPKTSTQVLFSYITEHAGVLVASGPDQGFQFAHRGFQEYLAACHLRDLLKEDGEETRKKITQLINDDPDLWREPLLILGDILVDDRNPDAVWKLMDALLPNKQAVEEASSWAGVWLCSRYFTDCVGGVIPDERFFAMFRAAFQDWFGSCVQAKALSVADRVDVATALGLAGDIRPGVSVAEGGVPSIRWCAIEGATATFGSTDADVRLLENSEWAVGWGFERETPSFEHEVAPFEIAAFTVTRRQFAAFADDPDGYGADRWWTSAGLVWRDSAEARGVSHQPTPDNLPQTEVSWFEAVAFCRWLSYRTGDEIALPTELEWELAARGKLRTLFSWGDHFDPNACNSSALDIGRPVPVGILGFSGEGGVPSDMNGNVWEWCSTLAADPNGDTLGYSGYDVDEREDLERGEDWYRSARGGSYFNPPFLVRGSYRGRDLPAARQTRTGFRPVRRKSKHA